MLAPPSQAIDLHAELGELALFFEPLTQLMPELFELPAKILDLFAATAAVALASVPVFASARRALP